MWGMVLVRAAKKKRLNVLIETTGRDDSMFKYVDYCFPDEGYRKLVVHFDINDMSFAKDGIKSRMKAEMKEGQEAVVEGSIQRVVHVNRGGAFSDPAALQSVKEASDRIWQKVMEENLAQSWYKADILVQAHEGKDWTARAISGDASAIFAFGIPD